jgi:hypothetical protein
MTTFCIYFYESYLSTPTLAKAAKVPAQKLGFSLSKEVYCGGVHSTYYIHIVVAIRHIGGVVTFIAEITVGGWVGGGWGVLF